MTPVQLQGVVSRLRKKITELECRYGGEDGGSVCSELETDLSPNGTSPSKSVQNEAEEAERPLAVAIPLQQPQLMEEQAIDKALEDTQLTLGLRESSSGL